MHKKICKAVQEFLRSNGGLGNGYETWVKGSVCRDEDGSTYDELKWLTPEKGALTGVEGKARATELGREIKKIMEEENFFGKIRFLADHMEHGCYTQFYEVVQTYSIPGCK